MELLSTIAKNIKAKDFFYILTHMYPDGDTLGSAFALCRTLQKMGKHAKVLCSDPIPKKFEFMADFVKKEDFEPECIISVDLADTNLLGEKLEKYEHKIDMCIDHHPSNRNYTDISYVNSTAAANSEIIYDLIKEMGIIIDAETATCLYVGVATDTGCFKYQNTTWRTHFIAAELMKLGANTAKINEKLFTVKPRKKFEAERIIYKNLEYFFSGKCAMSFITLKEMESIGVNNNELDGIASVPIKIEGVQIGITIREKSFDHYKISVRTKSGGIDANEFCSKFGGGGHLMAGGFDTKGTLEKAKERILEKLKLQLGW